MQAAEEAARSLLWFHQFGNSYHIILYMWQPETAAEKERRITELLSFTWHVSVRVVLGESSVCACVDSWSAFFFCRCLTAERSGASVVDPATLCASHNSWMQLILDFVWLSPLMHVHVTGPCLAFMCLFWSKRGRKKIPRLKMCCFFFAVHLYWFMPPPPFPLPPAPPQAFLHRIRQTADDQQCLSPEHVKVRQAFAPLCNHLSFSPSILPYLCLDAFDWCLCSSIPLVGHFLALSSPLPSLPSSCLYSLLSLSSSAPVSYLSLFLKHHIPFCPTDSVFQYWGHPRLAQRGAVCHWEQPAAGASPAAGAGTRLPPVCKCTCNYREMWCVIVCTNT